MRFPRLRRTDPTWLVVGGVAILAVAALASMALVRSTTAAPDLSTPSGVVTAYIQAVQAGKAEPAWDLLSQNAVQPGPGKFGPVFSKDEFRTQVEGNRRPTASRIRILSATQSGDSATVKVEVTNASGDLLSEASSQTIAITLMREAAGWRITSNPYPYQFQ